MPKIFICEDNEELADEIQTVLQKDGNSVVHANCRAAAQELLASDSYDLIIMDWELPDGNGVDICKEFRAKGGKTPILMLTGKGKTSEKEAGLDSGADDYLVKPFSFQELKARLRALMRRASRPLSENVLKNGNLKLDPANYHASLNDEYLALVPKEFALLEFLMRNPDQVFSAESLINHVWTADEIISPDTLRTYVMNLRRKVDPGKAESRLETVHGIGYRFRSSG